ncbi:MAG: hypothetical protein C0176_02315 [Mesoaciditoga sp.]|nr:MAG: hypothetical protein C0176_02315 [Mesoaciditoga sp.]
MKLTKEIYEATKDFPQNEKYGLSSQLQRAAVREEVMITTRYVLPATSR